MEEIMKQGPVPAMPEDIWIHYANRELAAKRVEWYAHTGQPYPGMDWLKLTW